jgi:hypothetical protein
MDANTFTKQSKIFRQMSVLMAADFWDRKGVLMVEFMQQGTTVMSQVYYETLKNCVGPFRKIGMEC